MAVDVIAASRCLMGCCGGLPSSPPHPFRGIQTVSSDETTRQSVAERAIRCRNKPRSDLEVDTVKMLAAIIRLALFEIRTRTRRCLNINLIGVPALTFDLVERAHGRKADVQLLVQCTASSWVINRVAACLEGGRWLGVVAGGGELVAMVAFLATLPAAPVARMILVAICEIEFVRCWLRAWQPLVDCDELMSVQSGNVSWIAAIAVARVLVCRSISMRVALEWSICTHSWPRGTRVCASPSQAQKNWLSLRP